MENNEPLFRNAHDALTFAFNYSGQQFDRSLMLKIASPMPGGRGLSGNEGAGQAGMIRREVEALGRLTESVLTVKFAPRTVLCSCRAQCCKGKRDNAEWINAVSFLADEARRSALAGTNADARVRWEAIVHFYTPKNERIGVEKLAKTFSLHRETVGIYMSKVGTWLGGVPAKPGKVQAPGLDAEAMNLIEEKLQQIGLIDRNWI